jgi:hypothetical protein
MRARHFRVFGFQARVLINKYGAALFAPLPFFVEGSSAIGAASAIISRSPFGHMFVFGKMPSFRTRAGAAIIDECD